MTTSQRMLKDDPLPWLLEEATPVVRHLALRQLLDQPEDAPEVRQARTAAMQTDPIASILAAQQPGGVLGQTWPRIYAQVPGNRLAAQLSRPDGS